MNVVARPVTEGEDEPLKYSAPEEHLSRA